MLVSVIAALIFALILALGILGAFWGRTRKKKLDIRGELETLRVEVRNLPDLLTSGKYSELGDLDGVMRREKVEALEKLSGDLGFALARDRERLAVLRKKVRELSDLVRDLDTFGAETGDLEEVLERVREGGIC